MCWVLSGPVRRVCLLSIRGDLVSHHPHPPSSFKFKLCVLYVSGVERSACTLAAEQPRESPDLAQPCPASASAGLILGHSLPSAVCGAQGAGKSASKTSLLNRSGRGPKAWISSSGGGGIPPTPAPGDLGAFPEPSPSGLQRDGGCGMLRAASRCHPPAGCPARAAKSSVLEQSPASPGCALRGGRRQPAAHPVQGNGVTGGCRLRAPSPAGSRRRFRPGAGARLEAEGRSTPIPSAAAGRLRWQKLLFPGSLSQPFPLPAPGTRGAARSQAVSPPGTHLLLRVRAGGAAQGSSGTPKIRCPSPHCWCGGGGGWADGFAMSW